MEILGYIAPWVLGSVSVGLVIGFYLGRSFTKTRDAEAVNRERQTAMKVLVELVETTERVNSDVECHNTEIRETADHMGNLDVSQEMHSVKQVLMGHITELLQSNRELQDDLTCTRYNLEEKAQQIDDARREARTDGLTGVANRKAFDEKLHLLLDDWRREGRPFVLLLLDLDYFKRINDSHGHLAGDRVLESVGALLRQSVREGDVVGRFGGDEFAILFPRTEASLAVELAESVRTRLADKTSRVAVRSGQVSVSASVGVAVPRQGDTDETIIRRADEALYRSKNRGRNMVTFANTTGAEMPAEMPAEEVAAC